MQPVAAQRTVFAAALLSACARRGGQAPSGPPAVVRLAARQHAGIRAPSKLARLRVAEPTSAQASAWA